MPKKAIQRAKKLCENGILGDVGDYVYLLFENSTLKGELLLQAQEKQPTHIMPRGARLDAPGTLHHVMVRGIEGNHIVV